MNLNITFTDCTPADIARLIQAAGPLGATSAGPHVAAPQQGSAPPAAPPQTGMAPPTGAPPPVAQNAYPSNPPSPAAVQPPAAAAAPQPAATAAPGSLTPEHLYEAMSKYAQTYKPDGVKAVLTQCGVAGNVLANADQNQLYWAKRYFDSMKPPGTAFEQL